MAGNRNGGREEWPIFYKVVFSPVSQDVRLPTIFIRKYGDSLNNINNMAVLKVPITGASWSVQLLQDEFGTWLGESGWQEFAAFYGIEAHHFLLFEYRGNAHFRVIIFDPNGSEIDYPVQEEEEGGLTNPGDGGEKNMVGDEERNEYSSYREARAFRSENPFLMVFLQPSRVGRYTLTFSSKFVGAVFPVPAVEKHSYVCIFDLLKATLDFNITIFRNTPS